MAEELKPVNCRCGGEAAVLLGESTTYFEVKCCRCGTKTVLKRTRNEAIETWNKAMGADTKEKNMVFLMLMGQAMNNGMLTISPKETIRKDCSYYLEVQDMGAHVPSCTLYEGICNCRCENCMRYAPKTEEI